MRDETSSDRRAAWLWYTGALSLVVLDQITKSLVRQLMQLHGSIPLIGTDFLRLTYVLNPGIAFGLEFLGVPLLIIFGWIAAAVLAIYLYRLVISGNPMRWPVMLFLAGAIGNSIDRTIFGKVTDFVDVDFPDFIMERWPVFNVADSCVTIGISLLVLILWFERRNSTFSNSESKHSPQPQTTSGSNAADHARIPTPSDSLSNNDRTGSTPAAD
jgi:signal peptidase II